MEVIVFFWFALAVGVGFLADSRGRSGFGYFLLSFLLSPLLGLIIVLVTADLNAEDQKAIERQREHEKQIESLRAIVAAKPAAQPAAPTAAEKKCPFCAETIKAEAIKCRFCGSDLPVPASREAWASGEPLPQRPPA